ncbi:MAG: DUF1152 domain-containing protein [Promethearchaeota archaeon]
MEFLKKRYKFPKLNQKKVLILGLGGGCDIISAYCIQFMFDKADHTKIIYGNTKEKFDRDLIPVSKHIAKVPPERINIADFYMDKSVTIIDRSIPRGYDGCPYIFLYDKNAEKQLTAEIKNLGFDLIIGVDTGGDSIIFNSISGPDGRDRRMVEVLRNTRIPFILAIIGPGSDGESTYDNIINTFYFYLSKNRYLGCFSLKPLIPKFRELGLSLANNRTVNIISDAFEKKLEVNETGFTRIGRGILPLIPVDLLIYGFIFDMSDNTKKYGNN